VSRSDGGAATQGLSVLRLGLSGMCASYCFFLRHSLLALPFQANGDEDQQNSDGDDGEGSAHCGPFSSEDTLESPYPIRRPAKSPQRDCGARP
jgi:hypothetical protein